MSLNSIDNLKMDSSYFNVPLSQEPKENIKIQFQSFSSTQHSSASPTLKDISNRNFSLNEILPTSSNPKPAHRRSNSQASDLLHPRFLFSTSHRNSLETLNKKLNSFRKSVVGQDCDEFNTTRSISSDSKKFTGKTCEVPKIFVNVSQNMRFCFSCDKIVEIVEEIVKCGGENGKVLQMFCVFVACWEPKFVQQHKKEICVECGNVIL